MYGVIYKVTNKLNKKVYIGQTKQKLKKRKEQHIYCAKRLNEYKSHFHSAIIKYGTDNFQWEQIDCAESKEELNKKEIEYIKKFDSINNGYNICAGGEGNSRKAISDETRKKMSNIRKGKKMSEETKLKISKTNLGHFVSKLTREKISVANKGRKYSEEVRKHYIIGNTGKNAKHIKCIENNKIYPSITTAADELKLHISKISLVITGKRKSTGGFHFELV